MIEAWLLEIGKAFISILFQPLFYWSLLLIIITSYFRRQKERKHFNTSIYPIGAELKHTWVISLISSLVISGSIIISGGIMTYSTVIVLSILTIVVTVVGRLVMLSAGYLISLAILFFWIISFFDIPFISQQWEMDWKNIRFTALLGLGALLLIFEAILCFKIKRDDAFPLLIKGKRGKYVGQHMLKRLSIIPLLIPVPIGAIESFAPWWPIFPIGDHASYGLMIFPMLIGVEQIFQGMFVDQGGKLLGKWISVLAFITALFVAGSFFYPVLAIVGSCIALFGRLIIHLSIRFYDVEKPRIFTPLSDSLLILSVIPNSPAAKMGLKVGEKIEKVHQHPVTNESEFYDALQENRTFCKLEVRTEEGELRFVQGALYQDDHYELGLVFVKEKPKFRLYHDLPKEHVE